MGRAGGVAWMARMVPAGSPGIRWIMKNTMIVTPTATGTSISSRRITNVIRPTAPPSCRPRLDSRQRAAALLAQPDVLHVVVAERGDAEAVHVGRGRVGVGRVVEEGHERVAGRVSLDVVVQRLPARGGQRLLGQVRILDDLRVVVGGEERLRARLRVYGERHQL